MTFQRTIAGLLILTIAGLAAAFYMNWKTATHSKLRWIGLVGAIAFAAV